MSDFKEIIDYLEVFRDEALSKSQLVAKVDFDFDENSIFEEELISVNKQDLLTNSKFYYNLESNIYDQGLKTLYLQPQNNGNVFYYKKIEFSQNNTFITKYKRVPDYFSDQLEDLNENTLTPINITSTKGYYYDQKNDIIIYANILNNTTVTNDVFSYAPNDLSLQSGSHIIDEGDLQNNKNFSVGYYIGNKELVDRDINTFNVINREVNLFKNTKSGLVNLFPSLNNKTLVYAYYEKGITVTGFLAKNNPAISLSFKNHLILLEFLNHTIFYEFDNLDQFSNGDRNKFLKSYISYIEALINQNRKNFLDTLQILYYIPAYVLKVTGYTFLWNLLDRAILAGFVTEDRNAKKESFLIHILEGLYESYYDKSFFMLHLLNTIQGKTRLEHLHYRIDTENNVKLVQLLFKAWKKTRFVKPDIEKNPEFKITNGPVFLPYDSQKWAGFYFSNANVNFAKQTIEVELETGKKVYEPTRRKTEDGVWVDDVKEKESKENYNYHPFYPIHIKNIEKQDTTIAFESIIPAFLLYVNENKAWWNNFVKTGEYIIDGVTTLSGIGNLAKFRHLARLGEAGSFIATITVAAGAVEVTSGTVSALLKITGLEDTEEGKNLQEFLFYLELITLAGEVSVALKKGLQKRAKNLVEKQEDLARLEKKLDDLVEEGKATRQQADEVIEELFEVAEVERRLTNVWDGGRLLSERTLRKRIRTLLQEYKNFKLEIHIVDDVKDAERIADWNARNVLGSFRAGPPPRMFLRKEVTELTLQHEVWHLEDLKKFGSKKFHSLPNWQKEELVWERIWQTKNRWTEYELADSYRYYKETAKDEIGKYNKISELEELLEKPYYKYTRYNN